MAIADETIGFVIPSLVIEPSLLALPSMTSKVYRNKLVIPLVIDGVACVYCQFQESATVAWIGRCWPTVLVSDSSQ